jgi:cell division protease FtsH
VHKISIIPRGIGALGYTLQRPTEDRYLATRSELMQRMAVLLGGRAAEELVIGDISTGAADDLARVTDIARDMVTRYGMADALGQVVFAAQPSHFLPGNGSSGLLPAERPFSDATADAIDHAVRALVDAAHAQASGLLAQHRPVLDAMATRLLDHETLDEAELRSLIPAPDPAAA